MSKVKVWMTITKALYSTHKELLKLMELTFRNAILKILQHKFASPVSIFSHFIHIQGSWYLTGFSLRIFNFYLILLFCISVFLHIITSPTPKPQTVQSDCAREKGEHVF